MSAINPFHREVKPLPQVHQENTMSQDTGDTVADSFKPRICHCSLSPRLVLMRNLIIMGISFDSSDAVSERYFDI